MGQGTIEEIDKINIREATKLAMKRAYNNLIDKYRIKIDLVLIDGNFVPNIDTTTEFIIKGDNKCLSIATASIIAKVSRDIILKKLDLKYPKYNWKQNKGYGTKEHIEAIKKYGLTPEHRKSFCKNFL
jgi:ribonuclease HII